MKRLAKWIAFAILAIVLAFSAYVAVRFMTLTNHTLDQCYTKIMNFSGPDRVDAFRVLYGCDEAAEEGMKRGDAKAFRYKATTIFIVGPSKDDASRRYYLYKAIKLGDNESKIDLLDDLLADKNYHNCSEICRVLASYPGDMTKYNMQRRDWEAKIEEKGCAVPSQPIQPQTLTVPR